MTLNALDLYVIADTLNGSLTVMDGGSLFHIKEDARRETMHKVQALMKTTEVKEKSNDSA